MEKLPRFPEFKAIDLDCKSCLDKFFKKYPPTICELTFSNLYIWRNFDFPKFTILHNDLCLLNEPKNEPAYFLPPIGDHLLTETIDEMLSFAPHISRLPQEMLEKHIKNNAKYGFELVRNHSDYVYLTSDLIELQGKRYDGKRNHIRRFKKQHAYEYRRISSSDHKRCYELFDHWAKLRNQTEMAQRAQDEAIKYALDNIELLGLIAGGIYVEGKLQAFSIGAELNPQTAVIHFEIANPEFQGLSQLINQEFALHEWSKYKFVNREQDLGLVGLRKAKLSYHPHHLEEKYTVFRT